jgi:serine/threonine protein kinase
MERYDVSLIKAMDYEPSQLTDELKLEISIEIASALIDLHSGKFKVSHNDTSPMNILMNLEEKEQGYIELKKLALADFGISSVMKKST